MNKFLASLTLIIILASCSNSMDTETGEIRPLQLLKMPLIVQTKKRGLLTLGT